jgi:hypothetical protein
MQELLQAGFSHEEVADWAAAERRNLSEAGFSEGEIDTHFGHPPFGPSPIKTYVDETFKAATAPTGETGEPKEITDFMEALELGLQQSVSGLLVRGTGPEGVLSADAPRSSRIAAQVGQLAGDVPAMFAGAVMGGGNPVTGTAGAFALPAGIRRILMDKYEKGEVANFADFWDRFSGAFIDAAKGWITGAATGAVGKAVSAANIPSQTVKNALTVGSEVTTMVTVGSALEGKIPQPDDFIDAALALGFIKGSVKMAGKLRKIYAETGVKPDDVASDIQKDPTIYQDLASDNVEIPKAYGGKALKEVAKKISVGESKPDKMTWEKLYTQVIDDLNPIREAVKESGVKLQAKDDPYQLARTARGTFGKADHFLEIAPFDFRTYENLGKSLKAIVEPVKNDLDGLRAYMVADRAIELHSRGIDIPFGIETAVSAVKEGKAKYAKVAAEMVEFQNKITKYLKDAGMLSAETYEAMLEANKKYVPWFRVMDPEAPRGPGRGMSVENPIKGIKGSERQIVDPLESIIKNTYVYLAIAERNAVGQAFIKMAAKSEHPEDFAVKVPPKQRPIQLREDEIRKALDEFLTFTRESETFKTEKTTSTTTGGKGETQEQQSKALKMVTDRVKEALSARGFSKGESDQMLARIIDGNKGEGKAGSTTRVETIIKEIERTEYVPELDIRLPSEAATIFRTFREPLKPNEIAVWIDGKRSVWELDPDVAAAFKATDVETANILIKIMAVPAKTLRAGSILSPDFIARNFFRDQSSAFQLSKGGYIPILDFVRGALSLAKKDEDYGNWLKSGGANAAFVSVDRQYLSQHIFKLSKETGLVDKVWNVVTSPLEVLKIASELTENATRLGEFKKVVGTRTDKGTLQEGAMAAREVTLDFSRIGAKMRALNMIAAFSNAQVQGVDRLVRAFGEHPIGMTTKIAASITLPSVLLWWANHDDPRYKEIPQWQKDLFWIVMTKDHIFRYPKGFEAGLIFGTVPERILDAYFGDNPEAFKYFENALMDAFLPNMVPNVATPIVEQFSNRSLFTGTPLVSASAEKLLPEYQYSEYTTEAAKALGRMFSAFPGMEDRAIRDEKSLIGGTARALTTPALLENYLRAWTGGLGMYALQVADKALREAGALPDPVLPANTLADLPVIKAFVVRYPSASAQSIQAFYSEYYAQKRAYETIMDRAKQGDERAAELAETHQSSLAQLDGIRETLTEHSQLVRLIHKNPEMSRDDKRQLIDTLYFRMIEVAQAGNDALRQIKEATGQGYGKRSDGTEKGAGFFGELKRPDGRISTELSTDDPIDGSGKKVLHPLIVPTLSKAELDYLLTTDKRDNNVMEDRIYEKAATHARERIKAGKSPFAGPGEQVAPPSK